MCAFHKKLLDEEPNCLILIKIIITFVKKINQFFATLYVRFYDSKLKIFDNTFNKRIFRNKYL